MNNNGLLINTLSGFNNTASFYVLDNSSLISGHSNGLMILWNETDWTVLNSIEAHSKQINYIIELDNGDIATGSEDNQVKIWGISYNFRLKNILTGFPASIKSMTLLENGYLACGVWDRSIRIWK